MEITTIIAGAVAFIVSLAGCILAVFSNGKKVGRTQADNERAQEILKQIEEAKKHNAKFNDISDSDLAASLRKRPNN